MTTGKGEKDGRCKKYAQLNSKHTLWVVADWREGVRRAKIDREEWIWAMVPEMGGSC